MEKNTAKHYAFICSIIGGYLFHLYAITNFVPNSDGIDRVFDLQQMTVSGRWFLHYASIPNGFMQMPAFVGLMTLLLLSISAVFLVDILDIKKPILAGLLGIAFISFPSLGFTFLYLFTASAYSVGILLSIFSVWCAQKGGGYWILAMVALACSMGTYQAYAPFAIGTAVLLVIKKLYDPKETIKSVAIFGGKLLAYLAASALLYYVALYGILAITGQELLPYLGMDSGSYPFHVLPSLVISCYKQVLMFFLYPQLHAGTNTNFLVLCNGTVILLGIVSLYPLFKKYSKTQAWRLVSLVILCSICPLALGFVQIISPWTSPTPLMQYPYVLAYVLVLFFLDNSELLLKKHILPGTAMLFLAVSIGNGWLCNLLYTASAQAHRATESYVTRLMARVEGTSGYRSDLPVYIIGAFPTQIYYADIPAYEFIDHYSAPSDTILTLNKHIYYYLNHWLNIPIEEPSELEMITISEMAEFQEMPCYPDDGSVQIIEDQVIVKVGETYLPKSDYELAYENKK